MYNSRDVFFTLVHMERNIIDPQKISDQYANCDEELIELDYFLR